MKTKIFKLWYDQALIASFWASVISFVIARTYLPLPEALKTVQAVLGNTLPLILLISIPVAVLRILNRKRRLLEPHTDPGPDWKYIGPDRRKVEYIPAPPVKGQRLRIVDDKPIVHYGPDCAECFETKGSRTCLGH